MSLEDEADVRAEDFTSKRVSSEDYLVLPGSVDENIGRVNPAERDKNPVSHPTETDPGAPAIPDPED